MAIIGPENEEIKNDDTWDIKRGLWSFNIWNFVNFCVISFINNNQFWNIFIASFFKTQFLTKLNQIISFLLKFAASKSRMLCRIGFQIKQLM